MSTRERWQLRYLDAWQASYQGDYANADLALRDLIDHSNDQVIATKASALLMDDMRTSKHYEQAFELANRLVANLPNIQDETARFMVLFYVSQLLTAAGQYDLAASYALQTTEVRAPGETQCAPKTVLLTTLYAGHKLNSSNPVFQQAIDACRASGQSVFLDSVWLVKSGLYLDENQAEKAISLLDRVMPNIRADQYHTHVLVAQTQLAQAYLKLGDDDKARESALAAIAISDPGDTSEFLRDAYQVLYSIEKKHGNAATALGYYERYVEQDIGYLNNVSATALAYDEAQQHTLAQKLETEKLSKQNNILELQQALNTKAMETSRLYIAMLLMALVFIAFWLLRLKRSQMRFKQLSCLDGLTGISNHQHFMSEAMRMLGMLEKKRSPACLISIDLDYFKQVNDNYGHAVGDSVLRHTVAICRRQLRSSDLFGRLGGEEFGILLADCQREQGIATADRIRRAIEASPLDADGCVISFSASVGMACTETAGYDLQRLCREADTALYKAKRTGRNRVIAISAAGAG
ncbi:tetratricopeptide repeat-containing diguanylate cyclase [Dyella mobilis]|nr:GGDEF domain-containing protein [Dyella mobilis]